jgi:hypothetical protein
VRSPARPRFAPKQYGSPGEVVAIRLPPGVAAAVRADARREGITTSYKLRAFIEATYPRNGNGDEK